MKKGKVIQYLLWGVRISRHISKTIWSEQKSRSRGVMKWRYSVTSDRSRCLTFHRGCILHNYHLSWGPEVHHNAATGMLSHLTLFAHVQLWFKRNLHKCYTHGIGGWILPTHHLHNHWPPTSSIIKYQFNTKWGEICLWSPLQNASLMILEYLNGRTDTEH